jgi:SagB-type dehydrogenase family enzyme
VAAQPPTPPIPLPTEQPSDLDEFFKTLAARRTWRHFADTPLQADHLSTILRWSFGVHGTIKLADEYIVPLKTSPSGGAMHPIEAFPIVLSVEGFEPGIYHYDGFEHSLQPLRLAPQEELSDLVIQLASGQSFVADAAVLVLLVARLGRNFWKYPTSSRTYAVVHQDAGHLSQTFYLIAARLGLASFYTAAIDGAVTRSALGLEDSVDAPMGLCCCGAASETDSNWLGREPFVPRESELEIPEETRYVDPRIPHQTDQTGSVRKGIEPLPSLLDLAELRLSQPFDKK